MTYTRKGNRAKNTFIGNGLLFEDTFIVCHLFSHSLIAISKNLYSQPLNAV